MRLPAIDQHDHVATQGCKRAIHLEFLVRAIELQDQMAMRMSVPDQPVLHVEKGDTAEIAMRQAGRAFHHTRL